MQDLELGILICYIFVIGSSTTAIFSPRYRRMSLTFKERNSVARRS